MSTGEVTYTAEESERRCRLGVLFRLAVAKFPGGAWASVSFCSDPSIGKALHFVPCGDDEASTTVSSLLTLELIEQARVSDEAIVEMQARNLQYELFRRITGLK